MYFRKVEPIDSCLVSGLSESQRFVDFAIGLFEGFETRSAVKKGIRRNRFKLNGALPETGTWVKNGDIILLLLDSRKPKAYDLDIEIVFEDAFLAIVNKPAGLRVSGNAFKTLENCLVDQLTISEEPDALSWALPIHRLDIPTSGLVIFAKTSKARRLLGEMLENRQISKTYHAIVHGKPVSQTIATSIDGKESHSKLEFLESVQSLKNEHLSLVKLNPVTGRKHQLRIHCASINCPIVGDKTYIDTNGTFTHKGLFLSATSLEFKHPITDEKIFVEIKIPPKFHSLLSREQRRWDDKR